MRWFARTIIAAFVIASSLSGCAYRQMERDMLQHTPAAVWITASQTTVSASPSVDKDDVFSSTTAALDKQKATWQQAISTPTAKAAFFRHVQDGAQDVARLASPFSVLDLDRLVVSQNPAIQAAQERFKAAIESYSQVTGLDEILRQYSAFTEGNMAGIGPMKMTENGDFPFPGILALKGEIASKTAQAAWEAYQIVIRTQLTNARSTFWELFANHEARKIAGEMATLYQRLESVAKTRYEAGKTSFQDVIHIRIKKETVEENLRSFQEKELALHARLRELTALPAHSPISDSQVSDTALPQLPGVDQLVVLALQNRQEIRQLQAKIGKKERMLELAETMILPQPTMNLSRFNDVAILQVGSDAKREAFTTGTTSQQGAGLPKNPWFKTGDAFLEQTRHELAGLRHQLINMQQATRTLIHEKWFQLDRARREFTLYQTSIVGLSQAALQVVTKGYESGGVAFADVIASTTTWLDANLSRVKKQSEMGIALARLEEAVGASPANSPLLADQSTHGLGETP